MRKRFPLHRSYPALRMRYSTAILVTFVETPLDVDLCITHLLTTRVSFNWGIERVHILSEEVSKRAENIKGVTTFKNPLFSSSFSSQFDDYCSYIYHTSVVWTHTLNQLLSIFSCFFRSHSDRYFNEFDFP